MNDISFELFSEKHISILQKWLKQPHVAEFWQETEDEAKLRTKYLIDLETRGVSAYVIKIGGRLVGYIQAYEAQKVGGGWWPDAQPGTYGIDQFIGLPDFINQGWGTKIIQEFVRKLYSEHNVTEIITDPEIKNARAIRCYEKVGFVRVREVQTPGGQALLMKLKR
jgi:RimJ/RimL family protein N-acetyltransferase